MKLPQKIMDNFLKTTEERLVEMEKILDNLGEDPVNKELYKSLWDLFHKIHGSAAMYGFDEIGDVAGILENGFLSYLEKDKPLDTIIINKFIKAKDFLRQNLIKEDGLDIEEIKKLFPNIS